jgi:hypothetical protein
METCPHPDRILYPLTRYSQEYKRWRPMRACSACCGPAILERGEAADSISPYQQRPATLAWPANGR